MLSYGGDGNTEQLCRPRIYGAPNRTDIIHINFCELHALSILCQCCSPGHRSHRYNFDPYLSLLEIQHKGPYYRSQPH
jgi:hypothetical protein